MAKTVFDVEQNDIDNICVKCYQYFFFIIPVHIMGTPYQILFITTFSGEGGFTTNKQSNSLSKISLLQELGMLNSSNDEF